MKLQRGTYSTIVNLCLFLGVVSALGYDRVDHIAWLVIGGCAAVGAITTYFVQHWQAKTVPEPTAPTSPEVPSLTERMICMDESAFSPQRVYHNMQVQRRYFYGRAQGWQPDKPLQHRSYYRVSRPPEPAELVSAILKQLHAPDSQSVYELAISQDGSITIRLKDDVGHPEAGGSARAPVGELPETIH